MSTESECIIEIGQQVKISLQNDIVSTGELRQIIADIIPDCAGSNDFIAQTIQHLLTEGVEVGNAYNIEDKYVKLIAWKGSVGDRCKRAIRQMESASEIDRNSAFWLCLRDNVDEYEVA